MPNCKDPELEKLRREKIGASSRGKKRPAYVVEKVRLKNIGKKRSPEYCQKMSEARKGKMVGEKHPMFGKHHSEETKQKMHKPHKPLKEKRVYSPEARAKMKGKNKGRPGPNKGKTFSKEWCEKLSIARKGTMVGERNPMYGKSGNLAPGWKGGLSFEPYCIKFNGEFKERVRAFFGHKCVECGAPQNITKLHVHHVNFNKQSCCDNSIPLFVALCQPCHMKTNHNRAFWEDWFTEILNTFYGGKSYLSKEEMMVNGNSKR
jgi:hypothetical protein